MNLFSRLANEVRERDLRLTYLRRGAGGEGGGYIHNMYNEAKILSYRAYSRDKRLQTRIQPGR